MTSSDFNLFDAFDEHDGFVEHEEKVRDKYVRAPFGYVGGKTESLKYLLEAMPVREIDNEVCGGSGVWSLNRPASRLKLQVFNDRFAGVVAFYRCLQDPEKKDQLKRRLDLTLHAREEFLWCRDTWESCTDDVERAARWYYMTRVSFSQLGRNFGRATSGKNPQATMIGNSLALFDELHPRVKRWQIENLDAIQCLRDFDSDNTVHYVDPDYIDTDQGIYRHGVDHKAMLETIFQLKGYVAVSGYVNRLYDSYRWDDRLTWEVSVSSLAMAFTETNHQKGRELRERGHAEEVLWIKH